MCVNVVWVVVVVVVLCVVYVLCGCCVGVVWVLSCGVVWCGVVWFVWCSLEEEEGWGRKRRKEGEKRQKKLENQSKKKTSQHLHRRFTEINHLILPVKSLRMGPEQHVPDSSYRSRCAIKLFSSRGEERESNERGEKKGERGGEGGRGRRKGKRGQVQVHGQRPPPPSTAPPPLHHHHTTPHHTTPHHSTPPPTHPPTQLLFKDLSQTRTRNTSHVAWNTSVERTRGWLLPSMMVHACSNIKLHIFWKVRKM